MGGRSDVGSARGSPFNVIGMLGLFTPERYWTPGPRGALCRDRAPYSERPRPAAPRRPRASPTCRGRRPGPASSSRRGSRRARGSPPRGSTSPGWRSPPRAARGHDDHAVRVGHDPVARTALDALDPERDADLAEALRLPGVRTHDAPEDGHAHGPDVARVADRAEHDDARQPSVLRRVRGELAPDGRAPGRRRRSRARRPARTGRSPRPAWPSPRERCAPSRPGPPRGRPGTVAIESVPARGPVHGVADVRAWRPAPGWPGCRPRCCRARRPRPRPPRPVRMASSRSRVAASASRAFVIAPPTITTSAPAATARGAVRAVMPPGHRHRDRDGGAHRPQGLEGVLAAHLVVDRAVDVHRVGAQRLGLARPARRGPRSRADPPGPGSRSCGPSPRTPRWSSRWPRPARCPRSRPAFAAASSSSRPASIVLPSQTISMRGNASRSARTASRPSAFRRGVPTSRRSHASGDGLLRRPEGAVEVDLVERELQSRCHGGHASATAPPGGSDASRPGDRRRSCAPRLTAPQGGAENGARHKRT